VSAWDEVTERKRAEEALRASEAHFRALIERSMDLTAVLDADGRIKYASPSVTRLLGYEPAELSGQVAFAWLHPDDQARTQEVFRVAVADESRVIKEEFRFRHKDGSWRAFEAVVSNLLDDPAVAGLVINSRDITDRRGSEEALRRSEADFRGLVEHAPLGIYRVAPDGRFLTVNPALIKMLGYGGVEEMSRLDIVRDVYADPERRAKPYTEFAHRDEAGTEAEWKRQDGSLITVRVRVRTVHGPAGQVECYEGVVEDVTEQRSLENQFRQAQRMEAVGRLAGGVAHDFNNILTAITGYSDLLLDDLGPKDPKRSDVEEIKAAALRAAALTRQLLAFSRKQVLQTRVLDLNGVVQTLDKMLHRLIGEDVKLELSLASALGAVRADPGQIEQVIMNLAVNSRDAMPTGGSLTIETANVDLDEAYAREHAGASPGRYVMLAVSDTGIGMDAETRSQIFEPFFTTKELGKGTGLGLATVYGIVKQSGGYVWVDSEPGRGATFKIYLPRVEEAVEGAVPETREQPVTGGRETVLLAEDDPSVRAVVSDVLARKGYRVLRAPDGQAALQMARGQPGEIHLLLTDLVMPGMTGRELVETLSVERPGLRVLYMSGYTDDTVVRHGVLEEGMPYLQKPFTPQALALKVREVLDRLLK
jgi:two-component system cell cycle sensor histidine kinase/response regulator CckA